MAMIDFFERALEGLEEEIEKMLKRFRREYPRHHRFRRKIIGVLFILIDNQNFIIMSNLNLKPGKRYTVTPGIIDAVNLAPIPGAVLLAIKSNSVDNPAVAFVDADGKIAYVGGGKANLTNVTTWEYTDEITGEEVTADVTTVVSITGLLPAELVVGTVSLDNEEDIPAPVVAAPGAQA